MLHQLYSSYATRLKFDLLMSSQMLVQVKPAPEMYERDMSLVKHKPEECVMMAAHAYDLRGAHDVGMRTIDMKRSTDATPEDPSNIHNEFDDVLDGMQGLAAAVNQL
ncbi:hypothetical protein BJ170DRAFT_678392 [Xylariales sp. AK1849]|nr:hypothetical protein BJ170DRAFT_678392 [Xylariales sp. AK1849]